MCLTEDLKCGEKQQNVSHFFPLKSKDLSFSTQQKVFLHSTDKKNDICLTCRRVLKWFPDSAGWAGAKRG